QIAVIELSGVIESSKDVIDHLYKQIKNPRVRGIVLRIESPGGAVGPSQEINEAVSRLKEIKPIVASMGSVAASGGLYAALGASKIFAQPGTLTGSIGVILQVPNLRRVTEKLGVEMLTIKSGKFKDAGNAFREMTEDERAFLQSTVDEVNAEFVNAIVTGRGLDRSEVEKFADGRVLLGSNAVTLKLVDKIGGVYEAAREVFEILEKPLGPKEQPEIFYVEDKFARFRKFVEGLLDLPLSLRESVQGRQVELRYIMY
ncbi:MAG: signal peptide peptidase SppA, partial [Deltaproteobacteria bacterium]|nr:signal peptide peptidase SppA [Deltaproteobacteria bacterium]